MRFILLNDNTFKSTSEHCLPAKCTIQIPTPDDRLLHDYHLYDQLSFALTNHTLAATKYFCMQKYKTLLTTSSIAPSTPHGVHQSPTTARPGSKKSSSGAPHHGSIVGPWSLASHPPAGQLVVGSDLITTALKNLYIPVIWEARGVEGSRGEG